MDKKLKLPLNPKGTAVWLVDNTALTFKQISEFCGMHELEIKGIADRETNAGLLGIDPVSSGQLTKDEIERCTNDSSGRLSLKESPFYDMINKDKKRGAKYTPIALRQSKPDAIYWLIKNVPGIKDNDIIKLIGTTKPTIASIRDRMHWNISNIRQRDPVLLGLCSQVELDKFIEKAGLNNQNNEVGEENK